MLPSITPVELQIVKEKGLFTIAIVPPAVIDTVWPEVVKRLEKDTSLWDAGQTLHSIKAFLESGDFKLWFVVKEDVIELMFLGQYAFYPPGNSLQIVWAMGEHLETYIAIALSALEEYGRANGCKFVEIIGRDGWSRPLRPYGYRKLQTTFIKEISAERLN